MKIDEKNFIRLLVKREERALEFMIREYGWIVKTVVCRQLFHLPESQEECMNDVFWGVWNNIEAFDPEKSTFKNWLAGIARYKSIDCLRKSMKDSGNQSIDEVEIPVADNCHIELLKNELSEQMDSLLSCLSMEDKELFLKLYVEEADMEQISLETGLNRSIIYNRLSRAKKKIRSLYPYKGKENHFYG